MPRELPVGTVTFLFTDIEGSTRLWEDAPTDMADAVRVHDQIVRGTIERHGGYVFGIGGDGFCAAFSTAADAAAAATESQEQLRLDDDARRSRCVWSAGFRSSRGDRSNWHRGERVARLLMSARTEVRVLVPWSAPRCCCVVTRYCGRWEDTAFAGPCAGGCRCGTRSLLPACLHRLSRPGPQVSTLSGTLPPPAELLIALRARDRRSRRARAITAVGHVERCRRGRQDPAGPRSRGEVARRSSGGACGWSSSRRSQTRTPSRRPSQRSWASHPGATRH